MSVLDCPFDEDDEVSSPFQHRLALMEGDLSFFYTSTLNLYIVLRLCDMFGTYGFISCGMSEFDVYLINCYYMILDPKRWLVMSDFDVRCENVILNS